ncbi:hypothetical protein [uncultured Fibrobacter sp.]|uniref:hypothetical protein n=1 Tax=uncultured Fibrobacter sp. TaxID=261512 RepID=UPI0025FB6ED8|nr:hypothetical protein [uncultured Fibrobacter sp.]
MNLLNKKPIFFATAAALFIAILFIVFRGFVFDDSQLMLNSDQLNGIGSRILRAENPIVTEWDDSRLGGVPTIDALFADAYHPLVWTQFLMDPARAVGFKFILTVWVAFMSAMLLAWNLTGNRWWAALLGFLYAFSPEYFTYIYGGHDGKMMVFAIAPLALLAIRKVVRNGSLPYLIVLALTIAWMILGSHLQLTYLFLWGAGFYTLYEAAFHCNTFKTRGKRIGLAAAGLAFGLALACFQLVPPYLYTTTQSVRGEGDHTNMGHAVSWSLHQEELAQMVLPGFIGVDVYEQDPKSGDIVGSSFISYSRGELQKMPGGSPFYWGHNSFKLDHNSAGTLLTFLGFLCLFLPGKRRWATFWAMGMVVALSYGMGAHSPLFKLWYAILPGVKNFRAPGMALFWLPLLLVMMAGPVLRAISDKGEDAARNLRALKHGAAMFGVLLLLTVIARYNWTLFIGPFGLVACIAYALVCIGIMKVDDQGKALSFESFLDAYKTAFKDKGSITSRVAQACFVLGFTAIGAFLMSGQDLLADPVTAPYFKPLNEIIMQATAAKIIPSFVLALATVAVALFLFFWKGSTVAKACIFAVVAAIELFFINGAFIQNVPAAQYLQPNNAVVAAIKAPYKADSLNTPRVLSLSRQPSLGANAFPQYHLRNADGFHDNELASYREFRGGQQNANYLQNINDPDAAHPFLDLMNVGAIVFDTRQGTTYMPISTAMGEAYIYGQSVTMDDASAIKTLREKAAIRKPKAEESAPAEATDSTATVDSTTAEAATDSAAGKAAAEQVAAEPEDDSFYYRETVILSEKPEHEGEGGVANGHAKLIASPKMDTQVFEVESDRAGFMVVAGNYHPYWNATVNGKPAKVYKAFGTLRAVEIPKGKSEVRMEYRSRPLHACIKVSAIAALFLVAIGVLVLIRRKKA